MESLWRRWTVVFRRAPVLGFALGGALSFFLLAPHLPWARETIHIDARTVAVIVERRANLAGRELSAQERDRVIEDHVREEILLRKAYRRGWHLESGRVRQRLLLAMRTALNEDLPEASSAQLRAYYQANADRYRVPESVTLSHVFFESGSPSADGDVSRVLGALARGADFRTMGDTFWLGSTMVRQTRHQLEGALGRSFADAVFALEPGSWAGPIESNRGAHFVRVDAQHPPELPELETMKRFVQVDWAKERRAEILARNMSRLRERYTIIAP